MESLFRQFTSLSL